MSHHYHSMDDCYTGKGTTNLIASIYLTLKFLQVGRIKHVDGTKTNLQKSECTLLSLDLPGGAPTAAPAPCARAGVGKRLGPHLWPQAPARRWVVLAKWSDRCASWFPISKMKIMTVVTSWAGERTEHGTCSRSAFQKRWYYHWWHALWPLTLTTTLLIPVIDEEPGVYQGHITSCLGKQWPLPKTPVPLAAAHFFPRRSPCAWSPREAIGLRQG